MAEETPEEEIVAAVLAAVAEQRLPAGTKLGEVALSKMFACNRANVRRALASLAAQHVVELIPNRGAFVITPTPKEAKDVFQARRAVERVIARDAASGSSSADIEQLRRNIEEEARAKSDRDRPRELRLSRQFHMLVAKIAGNRVMERMLADLTMRSTLIIGLYGLDKAYSCAETEHADIVEAMAAKHSDRVVELIDEHLRHLEEHLDFERPRQRLSSLQEQILGRADFAA